MRRLIVSTLVIAALGMSAATASAQTIALAATLAGSNEAPNAVLTGANAAARVTLHPDQTVSYEIDIFNMPSGTTQAHFHVGGPGLAGPIVVDIPVPTTASNDFSVRGTAGPSALRPQPNQGIRSWEDFIQSLVGGQTYLNVHSQVNPGGEIRGQVLVVR